jgi:ketosteroid isomerase-like protein
MERDGFMNHRTSLVKALCLAVVLLPGCATAPGPTPEEAPGAGPDLAAIRQLEIDFTAALGRGDTGALAKMIVKDFVAMPPDRPPIVGSEATMAFWTEFLEEYTFEVSTSIGEVVAADHWAFVRATNRWTATPKADGESQEGQATYLHIFQKQPDGSWKVARDIWNSDQPAPDTPTE